MRRPCVSSLTEKRASQTGITLVELLIAITILGIVSAMLIMGWINLQKSSVYALTVEFRTRIGARCDQPHLE